MEATSKCCCGCTLLQPIPNVAWLSAKKCTQGTILSENANEKGEIELAFFAFFAPFSGRFSSVLFQKNEYNGILHLNERLVLSSISGLVFAYLPNTANFILCILHFAMNMLLSMPSTSSEHNFDNG